MQFNDIIGSSWFSNASGGEANKSLCNLTYNIQKGPRPSINYLNQLANDRGTWADYGSRELITRQHVQKGEEGFAAISLFGLLCKTPCLSINSILIVLTVSSSSNSIFVFFLFVWALFDFPSLPALFLPILTDSFLFIEPCLPVLVWKSLLFSTFLHHLVS